MPKREPRAVTPAAAPDPAPPTDPANDHPPLHDPALIERLRDATVLLEQVVADRGVLAQLSAEERLRLIQAAGVVFSPDTAARRRMVKTLLRHQRAARVHRDETMLHATGIRALRRKPVFISPDYALPPPRFESHTLEVGDAPPAEAAASPAPDAREAIEPQNCYVCKRNYSTLHHFYDQMCGACGDFNFTKRTESADLTGRVALLTGGRVKIGYQAGLKLLRCGARLIVTTRFPRDSAARYASEPDFEAWKDRLEIFGLDLRHTPSVEAFCSHMLATRDRLDFIVNNACQTVRRPPEFYEHMMAGERVALEHAPAEVGRLLGSYEALRGADRALGAGSASDAPAAPVGATGGIGLTHAAELSQVRLLAEEALARQHLFPEGRLDQDLQQVDLRGRNSWRLLMDEVPTVELLEVQLVNAIAPFVLNARLKPLMIAAPGRDQHIVNVSAVEGQFYRRLKTTRHPHTNMAKAALNMMTRTSAADYEQDGIHMNSVDTGWVTDEDPAAIAERKVLEHRFHPPLDIVDGAARILDPIITGINTGTHMHGQFLKDYTPTDW